MKYYLENGLLYAGSPDGDLVAELDLEDQTRNPLWEMELYIHPKSYIDISEKDFKCLISHADVCEIWEGFGKYVCVSQHDKWVVAPMDTRSRNCVYFSGYVFLIR